MDPIISTSGIRAQAQSIVQVPSAWDIHTAQQVLFQGQVGGLMISFDDG